MTFKHNWEKTHTRIKIDNSIIIAMVKQALPEKTLLNHEIISGGCANLNIKLIFPEPTKPLILRIYLRDIDAAYREQKLANLVKRTIPIPDVYIIGDYEGYRYALLEFMPGMTLRDFFLNYPHDNIHNIMYDSGKMLAAIKAYTFASPGFFDNNLSVTKPAATDTYKAFIEKCLNHPTVVEQLGQNKLAKIALLTQKYVSFFPDTSSSHLVHADYDPANILVDHINGNLKITAILDWEFAFSGSWLCDVSMMLRYAHQMPPEFANSFIQGIKDAGLVLPDKWQITINLLNLVSLLDCLTQSLPTERPNQCADICELINNIIENLCTQNN